jgi:hypothetical protein
VPIHPGSRLTGDFPIFLAGIVFLWLFYSDLSAWTSDFGSGVVTSNSIMGGITLNF